MINNWILTMGYVALGTRKFGYTGISHQNLAVDGLTRKIHIMITALDTSKQEG